MTDWAKTQTHHAAEAVSRIKIRIAIGVVIFTPAIIMKVVDPSMSIHFFS